MLVTYTGVHFDFNDIKPERVHLTDIFHSLPKLNRFVGHSIRPYSVGEHTFVGLMMAEKMGYTPLQKLHWFIHDFTEAYVGDCPAPLKKLIPQFSEYEEKVEMAILQKLGLKPLTDEESHLVKRIDYTMLVIEMRDLTLHNWEDFIDEYTYLEVLDDDDFKISVNPFSTEALAHILENLFDNLLEEVENA